MRIFIVDDSAAVRERLIEALSGLPAGQIIGQAVGAAEAVEAIRRMRPDVVILDLHLREGNGIQVLQQIKKDAPDPIVLVLTNYPYPQYRQQCLATGADYFFDKSLEFDKVHEVIRQLL